MIHDNELFLWALALFIPYAPLLRIVLQARFEQKALIEREVLGRLEIRLRLYQETLLLPINLLFPLFDFSLKL